MRRRKKNDRFDQSAPFHLLLKSNNKESLKIGALFFLHFYLRLKIVRFVCNHTHFTKQTNNIYNSGQIRVFFAFNALLVEKDVL